MGTPFKMKGFSGFGNSPIIPDSKKTFDRIKKMKSKAKDFVKNIKIKDVTKTTGKRALGVLGFMGAGTLSASATPTGNQKKEGTYTSDIQDIIPKKKETVKTYPTRKFPTRKF
jgi:hypothetical protein